MAVPLKYARTRDLGPIPLGTICETQRFDTLICKEILDVHRFSGFGGLDEEIIADPIEAHVRRVQICKDEPVVVGGIISVVFDPQITVLLVINIDVASCAAAKNITTAATDEDVIARSAVDAFGPRCSEESGPLDDVLADLSDNTVSDARKVGLH